MTINIDTTPKYCINLPQDSLKKEWMRRMFKFVNLKNVQYVKAIDFSQVKLPVVKILNESKNVDGENETNEIEFNLSKLKPSLGCLFSHKAVFEHALANNYEHVLVMEDDVGFNKNFKKDVEVLKNAPENADFIALNKCKIASSYNEFFEELLYFSQINAYIINKTLMQYFIERFEFIDFWGEDVSFSQFMCNTVFENECNAYSVKNAIAYVDFQKNNSKIKDFASPVVLESEIKQILIDAAAQHKFI